MSLRFLFLALCSTTLLASDPLPDDLDRYIEASMKAWSVPGLAIAVVDDDRVVLVRGYGVREQDGSAPVDADTVFAIGSVTKSFTATALAMLVAEEKLDWDDPVTDHLPGFRLYDRYLTEQVTVRDLLTHRAGLPRGDLIWYGSGKTRAEIVANLRFLEPEWGFRERFGYQNLMYIAAGQLIPNLDGYGWDAFITQKLLRPLGMARATTSVLELDRVANKAAPHAKIDGRITTIPWRNLDNAAAAGAINASARDMTRWLQFNLGAGELEGTRLLPVAGYRELITPQTVVRLEGRYRYFFFDANMAAYGLGWFLHDHYGAMVITHGGAIDGMRAELAILPGQKRGLVVLTNMEDTLLPTAIKNRLLDHWLGRDPRDWSGDLREIYAQLAEVRDREEAVREGRRRKDTNPDFQKADLAGTYRHPFYGEVVVSDGENGLHLRFSPALAGAMEHWQYDSYRVRWEEKRMGTEFAVFHGNADGDVVSLVLETIGTFRRQP